MPIRVQLIFKIAGYIISAYKIAAVGIPVAQAAYGIIAKHRRDRADMRSEGANGNKIRCRDIPGNRKAPKRV